MKKIILFIVVATMCFTTACKGTQVMKVESDASCSDTESTAETETSEESVELTDKLQDEQVEQIQQVAEWETVEWEPGRELKEGDSIQLDRVQFYQGKTYWMEYDTHVPEYRWFIGENSLSASLKEADGSETELVIYTFCLTDEYMVFSSRLEGDPEYYDFGDGNGLRIFVKEQDGNVRQIAENIQDAYVDGGKLVALNLENQVQIYDLASGKLEKQVQPDGVAIMYYMCCEYLIYENAERQVVHYYLDSESTQKVGFSRVNGIRYDYCIANGNLLGYIEQDKKMFLLYEQGVKSSGVLNMPDWTPLIYGNWAFFEEELEVKAYNIATGEYRTIYTISAENEEKGILMHLSYYSKERIMVIEHHMDSAKEYFYEVDLDGNVKYFGERQLDPNI